LSVAFSPDDQHIISGSSDKTVRLWNVKNGTLACRPFEGHTARVISVAFSPDGKHIVSASADTALRVWDATICNSHFTSLGEYNDAATGDDYNHKVSPTVFTDHSQMKNGWILGSRSELLFWVPPPNRVGLWRPSNTAIMARRLTNLDLSNFVHGTSWHQCATPL
jgi:WD40 repeat protein